jgi:hypothetical protein
VIIHFVGGSRDGQTQDFPGEVSAVEGLLFDGGLPERYRPAVPERTVSTPLGEATVLAFDPAWEQRT